MDRWEKKLRREGLGAGRAKNWRTQVLTPDSETEYPHGLVSTVYALSAPPDYWSEEERRLRAKNALKHLILKRGRETVERGLSHAVVSKSEQPVLDNLRHLLSQLPA